MIEHTKNSLWLLDTQGIIDDESIRTTMGLSLFINPLLVALSAANIKALAFADDLVLLCEGEMEMYKGIDIAKKWSDDSKIDINFSKSAVLCVRVDKRTKQLAAKSIKGIPVKDTYTYLGI